VPDEATSDLMSAFYRSNADPVNGYFSLHTISASGIGDKQHPGADIEVGLRAAENSAACGSPLHRLSGRIG
jgi:hypothetical protein